LKKAIYWYNKATENENDLAQYNLGQCYRFRINNESKTFEYHKKSAKRGYDMSQNVLGILYENGEGIEKDLGKAIYWYNRAAENENEFAQYNLGRCHNLGIGIEKNETKAFEYFKRSAEKEYVNAQFQLGECYLLGKGIKKDETSDASRWSQSRRLSRLCKKTSRVDSAIFK